MPPVPPVFICYAHQDNENSDLSRRWLDRLLGYLEPLNQQGKLQIWSDQQLEIGDTWDTEIKTKLHEVKAAVLLVSQSLLGSKYIRNTELPVLLKRAKDDGVVILPIIVRACQLDDITFKYPDPQQGPEELTLSTFQTANPPNKPLNSLQEHEQDEIFLKVAKRLSQIVDGKAPDI
ncbi:toll/interleukin-1 receptor domain-containing protein [Oscillatoria sp. FACHB-1407]|uniref:toll/interleukin-1 receptor domain-containing protein n=1 Tax=Oscillatoria sp. FACHB-1407 TaxID=2692847 RepID=UPI0016875D28|nr:toll/interleukin-1 receptor domain-containing protein [Oscillatoria sp. FACHB-1407]MBD2461951.1 toll/interleukin-1 receptor domain-containing protein [Oscillatoria sp. FACHB-1407]